MQQYLGPLDQAVLPASFSDFRLDTVAVSSYSDWGDDYDSVLAHGVVDNLSMTIPPPPVGQLSGGWTNGAWQVHFGTRTNWLYSVEKTADFAAGRFQGSGKGVAQTLGAAPDV